MIQHGIHEPGAGFGLEERLERPVREPHDLQNIAQCAHFEKIIQFGLFDLSILLCDNKNLAVGIERLFHGLHGLLAAYEEGHRHSRIDYILPHGKHGQCDAL